MEKVASSNLVFRFFLYWNFSCDFPVICYQKSYILMIMKSYTQSITRICFSILGISLLFAALSGTIKIQKSSTAQDIMTNPSNNFREYQQEWWQPWELEREQKMVEHIEQLSGELLVSPKESWFWWSQIISSAQDFLYVWMYNVTHRDSKALIKSLARDGVKIRMIIEDDKYGPDEEQMPRGWGIQVRNDAKLNTNFIHAKVLVSSTFYVIQTANLTFDGFNAQREYYVVGRDKAILQNLKMLFEKDRAWEPLVDADIHPNLIVCPVDCREKISWMLRSAKESIYIENQYLEDSGIIDILYSQKHLDLKMIFPKDKDNIKIDAWWLADHIKLLTSPRIHAKAILIDKKYLIISSVNFSTNSLDNNREIGIIITNQDAIEKFLKAFWKDWEKAK